MTQVFQDDYLRLYLEVTPDRGILVIQTIARPDIESSQYERFEYSLRIQRSSVFDIASRVMQTGEVFSSRLNGEQVSARVNENAEAKQYTLVFTSAERR